MGRATVARESSVNYWRQASALSCVRYRRKIYYIRTALNRMRPKLKVGCDSMNLLVYYAATK